MVRVARGRGNQGLTCRFISGVRNGCGTMFELVERCVVVVVVPHITDAIQEWVERVAKVPVDGDSLEPDVCIIEVQ